MEKEYKSCVHSHTGQVQEPEDLPLPWQVHTTCSVMMERSIWSLGLVV